MEKLPPQTDKDDAPAMDAEILRLGDELSGRMKGRLPSIFDGGYWQTRLLDRAMKDPRFKLDLLRFVDVLPALRTDRQISTHINEYLRGDARELPALFSAAIKLAGSGVAPKLGAMAVRRGVTQLAGQFIIGDDPASALKVIEKMQRDGFAFTVDLLGEATVSDEDKGFCG